MEDGMVVGRPQCRGSHLKPCVRPFQTNNLARGLGLWDLRPSSSYGPSALAQMREALYHMAGSLLGPLEGLKTGSVPGGLL